MRDYDNMPKINWADDKATLAKIKAQITHQEPLIIHLPVDFNLKIDGASCGCSAESSILTGCQADKIFSVLAELNNMSSMNEIGQLAHDKGQVVDVNLTNFDLIVYD